MTYTDDWWNDVYEMQAYAEAYAYAPSTPEPEIERVRTQQEESAYRRYNVRDFPTPVGQCTTCREQVWSDQSQTYVEPPGFDEDVDVILDLHHGDCYTGAGPVWNEIARTSKAELDDSNTRTGQDSEKLD